MDSLFADAAERLFAQTCTPDVIRQVERDGHAAAAPAWQACEAAGFADALVPEAAGGAGLTLADALPVVMAAGRHLCPYPIAHTLLARAWLSRAGWPLEASGIALGGGASSAGASGAHAPGLNARSINALGAIALAPHGLAIHGGRITGSNVAWARVADHVLARIDGQAWLLPMRAATLQPSGVHGSLDAGVCWALADAERIASDEPLDTLSAATHAGLMAGAMERVLAMTLDYANQRTQFGKPIGRFQAVQQQISVMAEQVWAARMAAQLAFQGADGVPQASLAALGKARTSQAAPLVADIAHAVHGAIGVTEEYDLQLYTRRLREWRLADGSESYWHERIGAQALASSADALTFLRTALSGKEAA